MKKLFFTYLLAPFLLFAQNDREVQYIKKYAKLAVQEMKYYKIPASITLAQGILETGGGQSRLAEKANNHFGIKCKEEWTGKTITHDDDAIGECFRKYNSVEESYRDHSLFLAERPYYKNLFKLDLYDYEAWAHGLKKAGYATNPRYAYILISKIKKYKLNQFDKITPEDVEAKLVSLYGITKGNLLVNNSSEKPKVKEILNNNTSPTLEEPKKTYKEVANNKVNNVLVTKKEVNKPIDKLPETTKTVRKHSRTKKMHIPKRKISPRARLKRHPIGREFIIVDEGETLEQIADIYKSDVNNLLKYNELEKAEDLQAGQYVFFARKKGSGAKKTYKVQKGDNMYLISQKAGIRLSRLYSRNNMKEGQEPKIGEILYLIGRKPKK